MQSIPQFSTNSPLSSFVPIAWIIICCMLFEMVADIRRWREDKKANNHPVQIAKYNGNQFEVTDSTTSELKVGHIIKLKDNEWIPADVMLLQTGAENGICYVSTEMLDGERNLKPKFAPSAFQKKLDKYMKGGSTVEYIPPDKSIYKFSGSVEGGDGDKGLEFKNFIPRGATL
jgi:magnesium-transporting ATPase (P-type)